MWCIMFNFFSKWCDIHLRFNKSDIIDIILSKDLGTFSYEEKCNLKVKRPTPCLSLKYEEAKTFRKFQTSWYSKFNWLTEVLKIKKYIVTYVSCSEERMSGA